MTITVNVDGLSLCNMGSGGVAQNIAPDVCKTPPLGIPIPYANQAYSINLVNGSLSVLAGGWMIATLGSMFAVSCFDEPGCMGGVASCTTKAEASFISFSHDVFIEGRPACRLADRMLMNHGNTIGVELQGCLCYDPQEGGCHVSLVVLIPLLLVSVPLTLLVLAPEVQLDLLLEKISKTYDGKKVQTKVSFHEDGDGWRRTEQEAPPMADLPQTQTVPQAQTQAAELPTANTLLADIVEFDAHGGLKKLYRLRFPGSELSVKEHDAYRDIADRLTGNGDNFILYDVALACLESAGKTEMGRSDSRPGLPGIPPVLPEPSLPRI
ncbi:MAG: DUF4150 domain-containing protein [Candidatus Accumulibacter sp.]|jgi:hypothetical protein|nr:DUF4150 domain-containing protein [Accumulibacter sp.]